jgi:PAS domain-containing protein
LIGRGDPSDSRANASAALGVLYELAMSPASAGEALTLLHELQVHQVEIEMQAEELLRARSDLESRLARHVQLYDFLPVAYFTVDGRTVLSELNLAGARLLGIERDALLGRRLDELLQPAGGCSLQEMLARVAAGSRAETARLRLAKLGGADRTVHAFVNADPAGGQFLVALAATGGEDGGEG